ncbi:MAG: replication protein [Cocleimonas sp.]|nr:replication protein [Cocleimonas sp.]
MSLFRSLNEASLDANLSKNEAKVFSALMNQTIGYGKKFDHLTDKRLAQLTGVRLDRLHIAIEGVIDKDLFEVEESDYYDYRYQIAEKFIEEHPVFFTPHLPKIGMDFRPSETISIFQNVAPKIGHIHNNTLTSFNLTSTQPQQQSAVENKVVTPPSPPAETDVVVDVGNSVDDIADDAKIDLPPTIDEKHHATCHKALDSLTLGQQQRVLKTFEIKDKNEVIYNPVGLLIVLSKAEREGRLIVPKIKNHPSHRRFDEPVESIESSTNSEAKKGLGDHFGKLDWLRQHAKLNNQPMTIFAEKMQMSKYLEDRQTVQLWLTIHAKREHISIEALAKTLALNEADALVF